MLAARVCQYLPPSSTLALIFHQSGDMVPAFQKLLQNWNGRLKGQLQADKSFPTMGRQFHTAFKPTKPSVSYDCTCEACGTL